MYIFILYNWLLKERKKKTKTKQNSVQIHLKPDFHVSKTIFDYQVIEVDNTENGRVRINIMILEEPNVARIANNQQV